MDINGLRQKYPKLLGNKLSDGGIACQDGWYDLIDKLCADIDQLFKDSGLPDDKYPTAVQVKEKFGGLRFYMNAVDKSIFSQIFALISAAEQQSEIICEKCGSPGKIRHGGWWKCLCDKCSTP